MGQETKIQWADHTFNPWMGCAKVHGGCTNCYAEHALPVAMRPGGKLKWGEVWQGGERQVRAESAWKEPLTWARKAARDGVRRRVFCSSLADVLEVPESPPLERLTTERRERVNEARKALDAARERLWDVIRRTATVPSYEANTMDKGPAGLDWLLLTKRPENWALVPEDVRPLVWLGTSVSDQKTADEWVPRLLASEGFRIRFLSVEPLVGPVDLSYWLERIDHCKHCGEENPPQSPDHCPKCGEEGTLISTWGHEEAERFRSGERYTTEAGQRDVAGTTAHVNWVIVGGESGSKARRCDLVWINDIVAQCKAAGVPCFVKQLGSSPSSLPLYVAADGQTLRDKKGGDMDEWPEYARVRELPTVTR